DYPFTPTLGVWYHVAYTFDGSTHTLYVDGQQVASGANTRVPAYDNADFSIGAEIENGSRALYFDGKIDELEIFSRALSASEIQSIFNAGSEGKCKSNTLRISGRLVDDSGKALSGMTMTLTGSASISTTTDSNGNYSFSNLAAGGSYNVTPSSSNYSFSPTSQTFNNLDVNRIANF